MKKIIMTCITIMVSLGLISLVKADIQPASRPDPVAVTREAANGLPTHTVFRPADLSVYEDNELPVVIWTNGACRPSHYGYIGYLSGLAQGGYIVVAFGGINETDTVGQTEQPQRSLAVMDWLQSDQAQRQFKGKLDSTRIATSGTSCGGLEALLAAADPRVDAVLALNTGFFESTDRLRSSLADIDNVSVPIFLIYGGPDDIAAPNAIANYERSYAPFVLVSANGAGHNGLTFGIWEGDSDMGILIESINIGTTWLDYALKGDHDAGQKLLAEDCYYCQMDIFEVKSKGF
jgi:hypothetical protein